MVGGPVMEGNLAREFYLVGSKRVYGPKWRADMGAAEPSVFFAGYERSTPLLLISEAILLP